MGDRDRASGREGAAWALMERFLCCDSRLDTEVQGQPFCRSSGSRSAGLRQSSLLSWQTGPRAIIPRRVLMLLRHWVGVAVILPDQGPQCPRTDFWLRPRARCDSVTVAVLSCVRPSLQPNHACPGRSLLLLGATKYCNPSPIIVFVCRRSRKI